MIKLTLVTAILLFGIILYAVCVPRPVIAGEVCYTATAFAADVQAGGDKIAGTVHYHGKLSDMLIIVESPKGIMGIAFKAGCLVVPVPLDDYQEPELPTVAKPEGGA